VEAVQDPEQRPVPRIEADEDAMAKRKISKRKKSQRNRKRWSQHVTETSDALTLEEGVFALDDPKAIALSLKHSADLSRRRKSDPYRSAMSMLVFYINRAGKGLPNARKATLEIAKNELRALYGKD
jgi:hypothetical protein